MYVCPRRGSLTVDRRLLLPVDYRHQLKNIRIMHIYDRQHYWCWWILSKSSFSSWTAFFFFFVVVVASSSSSSSGWNKLMTTLPFWWWNPHSRPSWWSGGLVSKKDDSSHGHRCCLYYCYLHSSLFTFLAPTGILVEIRRNNPLALSNMTSFLVVVVVLLLVFVSAFSDRLDDSSLPLSSLMIDADDDALVDL